MSSATNEGKNIKGYRDLTQNEVDLMNEAKELAEQVGDFIGRLEEMQGLEPGSRPKGLDPRWIAIGKTDLQKGFMSLIRGIAQPTTF